MNQKIGRNDLCPCGTGKKYKRCCLPKIKKSNEKIENIHSFQEPINILNGAENLKTIVDTGIFNNLMTSEEINSVSTNLGEMMNMKKDLDELRKTPDEFNNLFSSKGWIMYGFMNHEIARQAIELGNDDKFNEAEDCLMDYYESNIKYLINFTKWLPELKKRYELINLACEDYLEKRYHSTILLLFTIIDGTVADFKELEGNKGFFAESEETIYAWNSIAAHEKGLTPIRKLLYQDRGRTNTEEIDIPYRNGIMHGRDLNYANKKVASKLWNTLFALREAMLDIKNKGTIPEKEKKKTFKDMAEDYQKLEKMKKDSNSWKPRKLIVNKNFPESGSSSDYENDTPEKMIVEFFENWQKNKFGKIVEKLPRRKLDLYTFNELAGKLRRNIFNDKKLISYKLKKITDENIIITTIDAELKIEKNNKIITKTINFRIMYENDERKLSYRTLNDGDWRFVYCFPEIKIL